MRKGTIFRLTAGRYSSYCVIEWAKVLKDFSKKRLLTKFLELHPEQREEYSGEFDKFVTWIVSEGYAEIVPDPGKEWHLGDYSTFDI